MASRLDSIEQILHASLGGQLLQAAPDLVYQVSRVLMRWGRTDDAPADLWRQLDSLLFNTIYLVSGRTMTLPNEAGTLIRVTTDGIRDIADRLLSLCYRDKKPDPLLKDALFDLSRNGSYAAMRELAERYPLDEDERSFILRVLGENGELQ